MQNFELNFTAQGPNTSMLVHNARLSNPLDPIVQEMKKVSSKRKKTEVDFQSMSDFEFEGGLYFTEEVGPYLPSAMAHATLINAGKKRKLGTHVKSAVIMTSELNPLFYTGKDGKAGTRKLKELVADPFYRSIDSVKVTTSRVMRTRPKFTNWSVSFEGILDTTILNWEEFVEVAELAGNIIGIGDWRPRFGRFTVTAEKLS